MNYFGRWTLLLSLSVAGMLSGCSGSSSSSNPTNDKTKDPDKPTDKDPDHSHERGKMLLADAGKYHALLTAHLSSKDGNELDIYFETTDKAPKPVALLIGSFTAQAKTANDELKELQFEPAPMEERPRDEKPGTCSHFVARAPWMKPADVLYVVARVQIDGKEETVRWTEFNPKKYAHHED